MSHRPSLIALASMAALASLSGAAASAAEVDTSGWTCTKCPWSAGTQGEIAAGVGAVSDASQSFGDFTGLQRRGAHLVLGGTLTHRGPGGTFADLEASELGLDVRRIAARAGREGLYALDLEYDALPRRYAEGARTPFLGSGGSTLTLPAGFPAATTGAMPLAATLAPIDIHLDRTRLALGARWLAAPDWSLRLTLTRDERDGSKPASGSFFATASQFATVVDQATDTVEARLAHANPRWQASLALTYSQFRNRIDAQTWANPFTPVNGGTQGQLAAAPDNAFAQIAASAGWQIAPTLRASADVAVGRGTQDAPLLAATLNPALAVALPAASLDATVNTFNGSLRLTATPRPGLRLAASLARDVREHDTAVLAWPQVSTDMFAAAARSNTPFNLTHDRARASVDWRGGPAGLAIAAGVDGDQRERSYHAALRTREARVWARASAQPLESLRIAIDAASAQRDPSTYGTAFWFAPENPLARKLELAERTRRSAGIRADWTIDDKTALGVEARAQRDDYDDSAIGLNQSRGSTVAADFSWTPGERTRIAAWAQAERARSTQSGSQTFGTPDWTGRVRDRHEAVGLTVTHAAIPDKLELGAQASVARSRSVTAAATAAGEPDFPLDRSAHDAFALTARWRIDPKLSLDAQWRYESHDANDWRLDGIAPDTVANLLVLGAQAPRYTVHLLRLALRWRF